MTSLIPSTLTWFDDFLGVAPDARYGKPCFNGGSIQFGGTGSAAFAGSALGSNGQVILDCPKASNGQPLSAALRIGSQPGVIPYVGYDIRPFHPAFGLKYEISGFIPSTNDGIAGILSTLGFCGFNDTAGGFLVEITADTLNSPWWRLVMENNGNILAIPMLGCSIVARRQFNFRIEFSNGGATVKVYSNETLVCTYNNGDYSYNYIPQMFYYGEMTCQTAAGATHNQVIIDALMIAQNRAPPMPF